MSGVVIRSLKRMKKVDYLIEEEWEGGTPHICAPVSQSKWKKPQNKTEHFMLSSSSSSSSFSCHFLKRPMFWEVFLCVCVCKGGGGGGERRFFFKGGA